MSDLYTVVYSGDRTSIEVLSRSELEQRLSENYYGKVEPMMIATGSHINLDEDTGLFLIPGFPIQPTAEAVVTRWKLTNEFDEVASGKFYSRDISRDGSCSVAKGEYYDAVWYFQKTEDAYAFMRKYKNAYAST